MPFKPENNVYIFRHSIWSPLVLQDILSAGCAFKDNRAQQQALLFSAEAVLNARIFRVIYNNAVLKSVSVFFFFPFLLAHNVGFRIILKASSDLEYRISLKATTRRPTMMIGVYLR